MKKPLRVMHISDLHFCAEEGLTQSLQTWTNEINNKIFKKPVVDIHYASQDVLDKLKEKITILDPDVIVVSGDVSTFGDKQSLIEFAEWSKSQTARSEQNARKWLIVPGNHDVLKPHLSNIYSYSLNFQELLMPYLSKVQTVFFKFCLSPLIKKKIEHFFDPIINHLDILPKEESKKEEPNTLDEYYKVFNKDTNPHIKTSAFNIEIPECDGVKVHFIPFSTSSDDFFWMNSGEIKPKNWETLEKEIEEGSESDIKIVVVHHNPISPLSGSDDLFSHAYNSMPQGSKFLKEIQILGVDLVLFGHQHQYSLFRYDFDLHSKGHTFALGSDASSMKDDGGFNYLEFHNPNFAIVEQYKYKQGFNEKFESLSNNKINLLFERNRPIDQQTLSARYELKQYSSSGGDGIFSSVQENNNGIVYMSGRHFRDVRKDDFIQLDKVLDKPNGRIRFLIIDYKLIQKVAKETEDSFWGQEENIGKLVTEAKNTLDKIKKYVDKLDANKKARIDVRTSHTLLPFAAYVRDPDKEWGSMAIKILPIGNIGDIKSPVFRLNRRTEQTMYDHYLLHLKYLFIFAKKVCGDWNDNTDLEKGLDTRFLQDN